MRPCTLDFGVGWKPKSPGAASHGYLGVCSGRFLMMTSIMVDSTRTYLRRPVAPGSGRGLDHDLRLRRSRRLCDADWDTACQIALLGFNFERVLQQTPDPKDPCNDPVFRAAAMRAKFATMAQATNPIRGEQMTFITNVGGAAGFDDGDPTKWVRGTRDEDGGATIQYVGPWGVSGRVGFAHSHVSGIVRPSGIAGVRGDLNVWGKANQRFGWTDFYIIGRGTGAGIGKFDYLGNQIWKIDNGSWQKGDPCAGK